MYVHCHYLFTPSGSLGVISMNERTENRCSFYYVASMPLSGPASRNRDQNQKLRNKSARARRRQCQAMAEEQVPKPSKNQRYCAKVKGQQPSSILGIPITGIGIESLRHRSYLMERKELHVPSQLNCSRGHSCPWCSVEVKNLMLPAFIS